MKTSIVRAILLVLVIWSFAFIFFMKPLTQKIGVAQMVLTSTETQLAQLRATVALKEPLGVRRKEIEAKLGPNPKLVIARMSELAALREAAQHYGLALTERSLDNDGGLVFGTSGSLRSTLKLINGLPALPSAAHVSSIEFSAAPTKGVAMTLTGKIVGSVK